MTFIDELDKLKDDDDFWKAIHDQRDKLAVVVRDSLAALDLAFKQHNWNALEGVGEDVSHAGDYIAELGNYLDNLDVGDDDDEEDGEEASKIEEDEEEA